MLHTEAALQVLCNIEYYGIYKQIIQEPQALIWIDERLQTDCNIHAPGLQQWSYKRPRRKWNQQLYSSPPYHIAIPSPSVCKIATHKKTVACGMSR